MKTPVCSLLGSLLLVLAAPILQAQTAVYAERDGKMRLVRRVVHNTPQVDDGTGKFVSASGAKMALGPIPEFLPVYVAVRQLHVETRHLELTDSGAELNREFYFHAEFESAYPLENVFVAMDFDTTDAGRFLFLENVGNLEPRDPKPVSIVIPLSSRIGEGQYRLHVFADGAEVFQSELPPNFVEQKLDEIVRHQIANVTDAPPKPFIGPSPEYPKKLRKAKAKGTALVQFTISRTGRPLNPELVSATDPAFGESALTAIRQWRFLPRVKAGEAVETKIQMPFVFTPVADKGTTTPGN